jgi:hypothetical protein
MTANDLEYFINTMNAYHDGLIDEDTMLARLKRFNVILEAMEVTDD